MAVDLRSEAGLLKSTLLHRLDLIAVPWGRLIDAQAGRGTFRESWKLACAPEFSVRLAEALVHGPTIEQAAAGAATAQAEKSTAISDMTSPIWCAAACSPTSPTPRRPASRGCRLRPSMPPT
jgi:hypothetical protein